MKQWRLTWFNRYESHPAIYRSPHWYDYRKDVVRALRIMTVIDRDNVYSINVKGE
jgi:hypothetical protein